MAFSMQRARIGTILIIIGVMVWPVGLYVLKWEPIPVVLFFHLLFVVPGAYLRGFKRLKKLIKR